MNKIVLRMFFLSIVSVLHGCVIHQPVQPNDPYYAPVIQTNEPANPPINGSLYSNNSAIALFTDQKAKRIGDVITVLLQERTVSSKSSNIEMVKDSEINISPTAETGTIAGTQPTVGGLGLSNSLTGERDFSGEAEADQSNQLSGEITVSVVDILPNGTLVIRGEKWITLNRGDEYIRVSGMVRTNDVTPENTVMSTKIANARITYSGSGEFADSQQMGWLSRFFNSPVWPF